MTNTDLIEALRLNPGVSFIRDESGFWTIEARSSRYTGDSLDAALSKFHYEVVEKHYTTPITNTIRWLISNQRRRVVLVRRPDKHYMALLRDGLGWALTSVTRSTPGKALDALEREELKRLEDAETLLEQKQEDETDD